MKSSIVSIWKWSCSMWREILIFILGTILVLKLGPALHTVDDTAKGLDPGVMTFVGLSILGITAALVLFFVVVKVALPDEVDRWWDGVKKEPGDPTFAEDWKNGTPAGLVRIGVMFLLLSTIIGAVAAITVAAF